MKKTFYKISFIYTELRLQLINSAISSQLQDSHIEGRIMSYKKRILLIGTNGIDIFYGIAKAFEDQGCVAITVSSVKAAHSYLRHHSFDCILVNLEPDGKDGVAGMEFVTHIISSPLQQKSIGFGISVQPASQLLSTSQESQKILSVLAGWIALPLEPAKTSRLIAELLEHPGQLSIKERVDKFHIQVAA